MNYNGNWKNKETGKEVRITRMDNTDNYSVWDKNEKGDFEMKEKILIFEPSHITHSEIFGSGNITIIDLDNFEINGEIFTR
jgi:hypothetical protein